MHRGLNCYRQLLVDVDFTTSQGEFKHTMGREPQMMVRCWFVVRVVLSGLMEVVPHKSHQPDIQG